MGITSARVLSLAKVLFELSRVMMSATFEQVFVHSSQFPDQVYQDYLVGFSVQQINHKFHYDSVKQSQKWLKIHQKYSPSRNNINQKEAKKNNEEERQILIIWDGATYHKGKEMRELLACLNQNLTESEWKVICELFAPNAPEENPIEAVWLQLKNLRRRCHRFCKKFNIIKRLFKLLVDLKLFSFPNLEKYDAFSCLV